MSPPPTSLTDHTVNNALRVLFGTFGEAESKDFSDPIDDSLSAKDYNYYSDSDLEDDEDVADLEEIPKKTTPLREHPSDPFRTSLDDDKSTHTYGERKERPEKGKIIKIEDVAFITCVFLEMQPPCR